MNFDDLVLVHWESLVELDASLHQKFNGSLRPIENVLLTDSSLTRERRNQRSSALNALYKAFDEELHRDGSDYGRVLNDFGTVLGVVKAHSRYAQIKELQEQAKA